MDDQNRRTALVERHGVEDLKIYHQRKRDLDELNRDMHVARNSFRDGIASFREKLAHFAEVNALGYHAMEEIRTLERSGMLVETNFSLQPLEDASAALQDFMEKSAFRAAGGYQALREQNAISDMREALNQICESRKTLKHCFSVKPQLSRDLTAAERDLTRWNIINIKSESDAEAVVEVAGRKGWAPQDVLILKVDGLSNDEIQKMKDSVFEVLHIDCLEVEP